MDGMQQRSDCACLVVTSMGTSTESVATGFTGRGNKAEGFFKGKTTLFDLRTPTLCPRRPSNSRRPTTTNHSSPFWFVLPFSFKSKSSHLLLKMFPRQKRKREFTWWDNCRILSLLLALPGKPRLCPAPSWDPL